MICTCHQIPHRQACELERAKQARLARGVERVDRMREERATGKRAFRTVSAVLRWAYRYRESKRAAKGLPLDPEREGDGRPNRAFDDPRMRLLAKVLWAEKLACQDAAPLPLARWLALAHAGQKPYWFLAEDSGHSLDQVKRAMSRAHRLIARRLAQAEVLEEVGDDAE